MLLNYLTATMSGQVSVTRAQVSALLSVLCMALKPKERGELLQRSPLGASASDKIGL